MTQGDERGLAADVATGDGAPRAAPRSGGAGALLRGARAALAVAVAAAATPAVAATYYNVGAAPGPTTITGFTRQTACGNYTVASALGMWTSGTRCTNNSVVMSVGNVSTNLALFVATTPFASATPVMLSATASSLVVQTAGTSTTRRHVFTATLGYVSGSTFTAFAGTAGTIAPANTTATQWSPDLSGMAGTVPAGAYLAVRVSAITNGSATASNATVYFGTDGGIVGSSSGTFVDAGITIGNGSDGAGTTIAAGQTSVLDTFTLSANATGAVSAIDVALTGSAALSGVALWSGAGCTGTQYGATVTSPGATASFSVPNLPATPTSGTTTYYVCGTAKAVSASTSVSAGVSNVTPTTSPWTVTNQDTGPASTVQPPTLTIGNGSDPAAATFASGTTTVLDTFTLATDYGSTTVGAVTVGITGNAALGDVSLWSGAGCTGTQYGATVASPGASVTFTVPSLPASTTSSGTLYAVCGTGAAGLAAATAVDAHVTAATAASWVGVTTSADTANGVTFQPRLVVGTGSDPLATSFTAGQVALLDTFTVSTSGGSTGVSSVAVSTTGNAALARLSLRTGNGCGGTELGFFTSPAGSVDFTGQNLSASTTTGSTVYSLCGTAASVAANTSVSASVTGATTNPTGWSVVASDAGPTHTVTPPPVGPSAPGTPSYTSVGAQSVTVSWTPSASGTAPITYALESAPASIGPWTAVPGCSGVDLAACGVTGLQTNTAYSFHVVATNGSGSATSGVSSQLTLPGQPVLGAYTGVTSSAATVNWTMSGTATGLTYTAQRGPSQTGPWANVTGCVGISATACPDSGLSPSTVYWYQVQAANPTGAGAFSAPASVTTGAASPPGAPGAISFANVQTTAMRVGWGAAAGATSYKLDRAPDQGGIPGTWAQIAGGVTALFHDDTGLASSTTYWYRVRGTNGAGDGPYSAPASKKTAAFIPQLTVGAPAQPAGASVEVGSVGAVVARLDVSATQADASLTAVRIQNAGTALATADVQGLTLYDDADGSGTVSAGDTLLATSAWDAGLGRYVLGGFSYQVVNGAPARHLLVTLNVGTGATVGRTFRAAAAGADVTVAAPGVVAPFTFTGSVFTIAASSFREGDATAASDAPVVLIVNPAEGASVTSDSPGGAVAFLVQARIYSPTALTAGPVLSTNGGTTFPIAMTRNAAYGGTDLDGVYEARVQLAPGSYVLVVDAGNAVKTVHSGKVIVGVVDASGLRKGDGNLLGRDNSSQLCTDCHALRTHSSHDVGSTKYGSWAVSCRTCHTPHGTTNIYLVKNQITPPAVAGPTTARTVVLSSLAGYSGGTAGDPTAPAMAAFANSDYTGVCQVCHTRTSRWTSSGGVDPNHSGPCTSCHAHTDGLKASCTKCHGDAARTPAAIAAAPPVDHLGNTATTVAAVGAHQPHLVAGTLSSPIACTQCHALPAGVHPSGATEFTWGPIATGNGSVTPAYSSATHACASTYCHGSFKNGNASNSPVWNKVDGTQATCGSCHALPPIGPGHPNRTDCATCHAGYTSSSVALATHVDGTVEVSNLSCSLCHGDRTRTPVSSATALDVNGQNLVLASPPTDANGVTVSAATGVHLEHDDTQALTSAIPCSTCHPVPTTNVHSNGTADVAFTGVAIAGGAAPTWNLGTLTCQSTYCHGNFRGGRGVNPMTWNAAGQLDCNACHGAGSGSSATDPVLPHPPATDCARCHAGYGATTVVASTHVNGVVDAPTGCSACHGDPARAPVASADAAVKAAPPYDAHGNSAATTRGVGAHLDHVNGVSRPVACAECHPTVPTGSDTTHANGASPIAFGALAKLGGATPVWSSAATTCASTYCHGNYAGLGSRAKFGLNATATWTSPATGQCGTCHAVPPAYATTFHVERNDCGTCHTGYTSTTVDAATHVNGSQDLVPMTCTSCHGTSGVNAAPPAAATANANAVGAHQNHVRNTAIRNAIACTECHPSNTSMTHADGHVDMTFSVLAGTGTAWSDPASTCASSYCHGATWIAKGGGARTVPVWTDSTGAYMTCDACHGNPPPAPHVQNDSCGNCHTGYSKTGAQTGTVNLATHVDGTVQYLPMTCSSCHGDKDRVVVAAAASAVDALGGSLVKSAPPVDTSGVSPGRAGAHLAHVNDAGLKSPPVACADCHTPVPTTTAHPNGSAVPAFSALAGAPAATWSAGARTCASTYCHGSFPNSGKSAATPAWSGAAMTCNDCHGAGTGAVATAPPLPHPGSTDCGRCHTGYSSTTVLATTHVNGIVEKPTGCAACHGDPTRNLAGVPGADLTNGPAAPPYDAAGGSLVTTRKVGAHLQHVGNALAFSSRAVACTECHAAALPTGTDTTHANGATPIGFTLATLAKTGGVTPTWNTTSTSCAATYCHGNFTGGLSAAPAFTNPASGGCGTCHGLPPPVTGGIHHPQATRCDWCHAGYSQTGTNAATHVDGTVQHAPATGCTQCHGDVGSNAVATGAISVAPGVTGALAGGIAIDSTGATATTSHGVGAHRVHVTNGGIRNALACAECHPANYTDAAHADGAIALPWSTLSKTRGAAPAYVTAAGPTQYSCTSVYCHGATLASGGSNTTPRWTSVNPGACGTCHALPPPQASGHPTATDCARCHGAGYVVTGPTSGTISGNALNTHVDGTVTLVGTESCTSCHGGYVANQGQPGADANVLAAPPYDTDGRTAGTLAVGAHQAHVNHPAAGRISNAFTCASCHSPVPTSYQHANGVTNVTFTAIATTGGITAAKYTAPSCSATYCHGNFTGGLAAAPSWTGAALTCTGCHGAPPTPAPASGNVPASYHPGNPACATCHSGYTASTVNAATHVDGTVQHSPATGCTQCHGDVGSSAVASGAVSVAPGVSGALAGGITIDSKGSTQTTAKGVGAHNVHVTNGNLRNALACSECHVVPATGDRTHADGAFDFGWGALSRTGGVTPAYAGNGGQCSNVYCHGTNIAAGGSSLSPTWTAVVPGRCGTCHASPPPLQAGSPHPKNTACATCHGTGYAQTGVTLGALGTHVNGTVEQNGHTGCTLCHGDLSATGVTSAAPTTAAPGVNANAVDVSGHALATDPAVGAHRRHLLGTTYRSAGIACAQCHVVPPDGDWNHATGTGTNGARATLTWGNLATGAAWSAVAPAYTGSNTASTDARTGTCATTYCHGAFKNGLSAAPSWTAAGLDCNSCHGRGTGATATPPGGTHVNNSTCANCHAGYTGTTVNATAHLNGTVDISNMDCGSCHGVGTGKTRTLPAGIVGAGDTNLKAGPPVDTNGVTASNPTGPHLSHILATDRTGTTTGAQGQVYLPIHCTECHGSTDAYGLTHADTTTHVVWTSSTVATLGGVSASWTFGNPGSCVTYCHGDGLAAASRGSITSWTWNQTTTSACSSCHGMPPDPTGTHNGVGTTAAACNTCHAETVDAAGKIVFTGSGASATTKHMNGQLDGGISSGNQPCLACHKYDMVSTSKGALNAEPARTTVYHHVMEADLVTTAPNTITSYPTSATPTVATTTPYDKTCVQCHADHNVFSSKLNVAAGVDKGDNLRAAIATAPPTAATGTTLNQAPGTSFTNADWAASGAASPGICLSCHVNAQAKNATDQKGDSTTQTYAVEPADFAGSSHSYLVAGSLKTGIAFAVNCTKCHSSSTTKYQDGTYQFALHDSPDRRLRNPMGMAAGDNYEENFCFRCHSETSDPAVGGAKSTAGRDWFGAAGAAMSPSAEKVYKGFNGTPASSTWTTGTLYFETTTTTGLTVPQTGDTLAGGTQDLYSMDPSPPTAAYLTDTITTNQTAARIWGVRTFASPTVTSAVTVPAGTWTLKVQARQNSTALTGRVRYLVYVWRAGAAQKIVMGTAAVTDTQALATTTAPGGALTIAIAGSQVSLLANDQIAVDLELSTNTTGTTYNSAFYFGSGAAGSLALPGTVQFNFASPASTPVTTHDVGGYAGIHRPNPVDETGAYIGANKHVECEDCHDPHSAGAGLHTPGSNVAGGALRGAFAVPPTFTATNWGGVASYGAVTTVGASTPEAWVCFRCHSSYNTAIPASPASVSTGSWASAGSTTLGFTNVAFALNPANRSFHPVLSALGTGTGSTILLAASQLVGTDHSWTPGQKMTCTDCHNADAASPAAQGPHGSAVQFMLSGTNKAWPYTVAGATSGTLRQITSSETSLGSNNGLFCRNCHPNPRDTTNPAPGASNGLHRFATSQHTSGTTNYIACVSCHIRVPHGGKVSRLIRTNNDANIPARYLVTATGSAIQSFQKSTNKDSYSGTAGWQQITTCTQHGTTTLAGEKW